MNIREAINKVILEEHVIVESNNVTFDTFMVNPMRNQSDNIINGVKILKTNNVRNDLIEKVVNIKIKVTRKYLIGCIENLTINDSGNNFNRENVSEIQVQFADDPDGKTHQNLFSSRMIDIRNE